MEGIAVLVAWYGIGLATVWAMSRAGHDALPWAFTAWMIGAVTPLVALAYAAHRRHRDRPDEPRPTPAVRSRVAPVRANSFMRVA